MALHNLDVEEKTRIAELYNAGKTVEEIACEFNVDFADMEVYCAKAFKPQKSRFEHLNDQIVNLEEDVEKARDKFENNLDDNSFAYSYTALLKEFRATIVSAQNLVKPEDQVDELIDLIVNPTMRSLVQMLTEELSRLKDELISQGMNEEQVLRASKLRLTAMGSHCRRIMTHMIQALNKYHGVQIQRTVVKAKPLLNETKTVH